MSIIVELTYDMSKALGVQRLELGGARTVRDVLRMVQEKFGESQGDFEKLSRVASVAVNGVLINHRKGMRTRLSDGDTLAFLKPAAGG